MDMARSVMEVKTKKARKLDMMRSKEMGLNISMQELEWGDWNPYYVFVWKSGVEMYKDHAEYMRKWNARKVAMA